VPQEFSIIGTLAQNIYAKQKVTGKGQYIGDIVLPGMLFGKILRSDCSHSKIKRIDTKNAEKVPGVIKVLTAKDISAEKFNTGLMGFLLERPEIYAFLEDQTILTDEPLHHGDSIAAVIAETEEIATSALSQIQVEYEKRPLLLTAQESMKPSAYLLKKEKPGNIAFEFPKFMDGGKMGWGDVEKGFSEADIILEDRFYVSKQKHCQMGNHGCIALYNEEGNLKIWTESKMPQIVKRAIAKIFDIPIKKIQIITPLIGGDFGSKGMVVEPHCVAMALCVPGRPVKLEYTRDEDFIGSETRHPGYYWMKLGAKKDGTLTALDAEFILETGAYYTQAAATSFLSGSWLLGLYKIPHTRYVAKAIFTNVVPSGAFRGFGNPQANFALEQMIDRLCNELDMDPVEFRLKNHKTPGDLGPFGTPLHSCGLDECLRRGMNEIGWKEKRKRTGTNTGTKRRGLGVAAMCHTSGAYPVLLEQTEATVRLNEDGSVDLICACTDLGTGAHTALSMIVAEELGLDFKDVRYVTGDTDITGFDTGAHASRTMYVGGLAVIEACKDLKRKILHRAAELMEASPDDLELQDKSIYVKASPEKRVTLKEIGQKSIFNFRYFDGGQLFGYSGYLTRDNAPPFGAAFSEVEVDIETGIVKVIKIILAHDIGRAIHLPSVELQLEGALHQGLGYAFVEDMIFDQNTGKCLNNNFIDYKLLKSTDMPKCKVILIEQPDPTGPYGAKSVAESGMVHSASSIANAIYNAIGIQIKELPMTPEKILKLLNQLR